MLFHDLPVVCDDLGFLQAIAEEFNVKVAASIGIMHQNRKRHVNLECRPAHVVFDFFQLKNSIVCVGYSIFAFFLPRPTMRRLLLFDSSVPWTMPSASFTA